jgi:uncharacterized membrane protein YhaH (DUF805 family)
VAERFSFDGALMHFTRTKGPGGFFWKFLLSYCLITLTLLVGIGALMFEPIMDMTEQVARIGPGPADPDQITDMVTQMMLFAALFGVVFLFIWAAFESAILRRYIRGDGFSLKFGGDEWRLVLVGLIWLVLIIGLYFGFVMLLASIGGIIAAASNGDAWPVALVLVPLGLAALGLAVWLIVRLSPAGAITIRDRRLAFFLARQTTRSRFWPMFGAFLLLMIGYMIVSFVLQLLLGAGLGMAMAMQADQVQTATAGGTPPGEVMRAMFTNPVILIPLMLFYVPSILFGAAYQYVLAGVPAHAALTDPRWNGGSDLAQTFA